MVASAHLVDAQAGIAKCGGDQRVEKRCAESGNPAVITTPKGHPVIREWEYAEGPVLVFSQISSCLGAVQLTGRNSLRGFHASIAAFKIDQANFDRAMKFAGFDEHAPIYYFGCNLTFWKKGSGDLVGLGNTRWMPWAEAKDAPRLPGFTDEDTKCWIFETTGNDVSKVTHHTF